MNSPGCSREGDGMKSRFIRNRGNVRDKASYRIARKIKKSRYLRSNS